MFRRKRRCPQPWGDPEGVKQAEQELRVSEAAHAKTVKEVIVPLRRIREQNNVTAMAKALLDEGRGRGNAGAVSH